MDKTEKLVRNTEGRSRNHCCSGKARSITYSECVFLALVTEHTRLMHSIILTTACLPLQYFSILFHISKTFGEKKMLLNIKCVFWVYLQLLSETFLTVRRTGPDIIRNVYWSLCEASVILGVHERNFRTDFRITFKYETSWKFVQWEPSCGESELWTKQTNRKCGYSKIYKKQKNSLARSRDADRW